jgi:2-phosphosulfolactate phosphatase
MQVEVLFTPAELTTLAGADLSDTACAVFDVLRATSTMVTALMNGARAIRPVASIEEALAERARLPECLLAGERGGVRITAEQTGERAFDLGNSPREFTPELVTGKTIVMTTTNGTQALRACAAAPIVVAGALLNLAAAAAVVRHGGPRRVLVVCSGTGPHAAYEDALAAGAFCAALGARAELTDSARIARAAWHAAGPDPGGDIRNAANARRLLANPDLADDVEFCLQFDIFNSVPVLSEGLELRLQSAR